MITEIFVPSLSKQFCIDVYGIKYDGFEPWQQFTSHTNELSDSNNMSDINFKAYFKANSDIVLRKVGKALSHNS